jgi:hypothetical protein
LVAHSSFVKKPTPWTNAPSTCVNQEQVESWTVF